MKLINRTRSPAAVCLLADKIYKRKYYRRKAKGIKQKAIEANDFSENNIRIDHSLQ